MLERSGRVFLSSVCNSSETNQIRWLEKIVNLERKISNWETKLPNWRNIWKLSVEIGKRTEESNWAAANHGGDSSPESKAKSVEFIIAQYDELQAFRKYASEEIKKMKLKLNSISDACDRISKSIDGIEIYSYRLNVNITGLPLVNERESSEQTANFCLQLCRQIGVKEISINGIHIARRVPARKPSNRPNAVICKFVRRLAKEKVMTARRAVRNINIQQLGFSSGIDVTNPNNYDHLTPSFQQTEV